MTDNFLRKLLITLSPTIYQTYDFPKQKVLFLCAQFAWKTQSGFANEELWFWTKLCFIHLTYIFFHSEVITYSWLSSKTVTLFHAKLIHWLSTRLLWVNQSHSVLLVDTDIGNVKVSDLHLIHSSILHFTTKMSILSFEGCRL